MRLLPRSRSTTASALTCVAALCLGAAAAPLPANALPGASPARPAGAAHVGIADPAHDLSTTSRQKVTARERAAADVRRVDVDVEGKPRRLRLTYTVRDLTRMAPKRLDLGAFWISDAGETDVFLQPRAGTILVRSAAGGGDDLRRCPRGDIALKPRADQVVATVPLRCLGPTTDAGIYSYGRITTRNGSLLATDDVRITPEVELE